ncbi:MAG: hypothetical protein HGA95_04235, partial [Caldiserica bacterium]|nr:hypothetical protein [Caldisericota bacterium]
MLVGLLPFPDIYNPHADPKMAMVQQRAVLVKLAKNNYISEADIAKYNVMPKIKVLESKDYRVRSLNYFTDYIVSEMKKKYSDKELAEGGFKIHTTIYKDYQIHAAESIKKVFDDAIKNNQFSNKVKDEHGVFQPQACTISMDPKTGYILAMVGGRDYSNTQFNRILKPNIRHPGSSFKVFDYCTAFETMSVTGGSMLTSDEFGVNGWYPGEWSGYNFGNLLTRGALENSSNVCALKTGLRAGLRRVAYFAAKMGLKTDIPEYPSITIGSIDVTAIDMCTAYNTVAAKGIRHDPVSILSVQNKDGYEIFRHHERSFRAISEQSAFIMTSIFRTVIEIRRSDYSRSFEKNIAAKSGTSTESLSGWYCTFTPEITVVSYVGKDSKNVKNSVVNQIWGSQFASPINGGYLNGCLNDPKHPLKIAKFSSAPKDVFSYPVCKITGMRATEFCPKEPPANAKGEQKNLGVVWEWFRKGTEPTHPCTIHFEDQKEYMVIIMKDANGKDVMYKVGDQGCPNQVKVKLPKVEYENLPVMKDCQEQFEFHWYDETGNEILFENFKKPTFKIDQPISFKLKLNPELIGKYNEIEVYWNEMRIKDWRDGAVDNDSPDMAVIDITKELELKLNATGNPGSTINMELIFRGEKYYQKRDFTVELTP